MSKLQVSVSENGMVFQRTDSKGALVNVPGDFAFLELMDEGQSLKVLKQDVKTVGERTRAALSDAYRLLSSSRMEGYKGNGNINAEAKLPNEVRNAMREAESAYFRPQFPEGKAGQKDYDTFIQGIRDAGIYATVKGVALKYFWFAGKLPCAYNTDGTPDTGKLLSVSAMQKLLQNMVDEKAKPDESIAARLGSLMAEFCEDDTLTRADCVVLLARLGVFTQEVKEAINVIDTQGNDGQGNLNTPAEKARARDAEIQSLIPA